MYQGHGGGRDRYAAGYGGGNDRRHAGGHDRDYGQEHGRGNEVVRFDGERRLNMKGHGNHGRLEESPPEYVNEARDAMDAAKRAKKTADEKALIVSTTFPVITQAV